MKFPIFSNVCTWCKINEDEIYERGTKRVRADMMTCRKCDRVVWIDFSVGSMTTHIV